MGEDIIFREDVFERVEPWVGPEEGRDQPVVVAPETVAGILAVLLAGGGRVAAVDGGRWGLWKRTGLVDLMAGWR